MSLNLAMHIMGVNLSHLDYLVKILDIKPVISESLSSTNEKNSEQNVIAKPKNQSDSLSEQLQLRHTDDETKDLKMEKFLEFCNGKESKWRNATSDLPQWKTRFTSPLRTTASSVFHVLGANEQLFYLEDDNEGFGVPIPYDFKADGDQGYFYANYFGDQEPYNYSGSNNSTELVDGIMKISEIFMGERKNLATRQEQIREPEHPEDQEAEAEECEIFDYMQQNVNNLSHEDTSATESASSDDDDDTDDWRDMNIEALIS